MYIETSINESINEFLHNVCFHNFYLYLSAQEVFNTFFLPPASGLIGLNSFGCAIHPINSMLQNTLYKKGMLHTAQCILCILH